MALVGYTKTCGLRSGGVKTLYLVEVADLTSFTFVDPAYTVATMVTDKVFKKYEFDQDSCEFKESMSMENDSLMVTQTIEFFIPKNSAESRVVVSEIALAGVCGLIAIFEDSNGIKKVVGYSQNMVKERPLMPKTGESTTGKKMNDQNGLTLVLECITNEHARIFTGTIPV